MSDELKQQLEAAQQVVTQRDSEIAELRKQLEDFLASQGQAEVQAKVDAAVAEVQAKLDDVQSKLDTAVVEAQAQKEQRESLEAFLADEARKAEEAKEIAARRDERLTKIREAANMPEEYLADNGDRFAAMSDEDFAKALDDWRAVAGDKRPPKKTSLETTRETASHHNGGDDTWREVMGLRLQGIDPRQITSRGVR